jgi:hypothetical protein
MENPGKYRENSSAIFLFLISQYYSFYSTAFAWLHIPKSASHAIYFSSPFKTQKNPASCGVYAFQDWILFAINLKNPAYGGKKEKCVLIGVKRFHIILQILFSQ